MSCDILRDRLLLFLIALFGRRFFSDSVETATFEEHLDRTSLDLPSLDWGGAFTKVNVSSLAGQIQAGLRVVRSSPKLGPVLIWHQGGGEVPFDKIIKAAFPDGVDSDLTVVAIKTPFQSSHKELKREFAHFNNYVAMIASVVALTEALIRAPQLSGASNFIVGGYSLGGFVAGRHHLIYNSADAYVPFVSGTAHAEIFFTTVKAAKLALAHPDLLRSRLNFTTEWAEMDHPNVYPVLGKYDQLNRLSVQGPSYGDMPYDLWEGGHLYGVRHPELIRKKIESVAAEIEAARGK